MCVFYRLLCVFFELNCVELIFPVCQNTNLFPFLISLGFEHVLQIMDSNFGFSGSGLMINLVKM